MSVLYKKLESNSQKRNINYFFDPGNCNLFNQTQIPIRGISWFNTWTVLLLITTILSYDYPCQNNTSLDAKQLSFNPVQNRCVPGVTISRNRSVILGAENDFGLALVSDSNTLTQGRIDCPLLYQKLLIHYIYQFN